MNELVGPEKSCPGPVCQGSPTSRLNFRSPRSTLCRRCEQAKWTASVHTRGTPHAPWRHQQNVPKLCGLCRQPETALTDRGQPRELVAYVDAATQQLVGFICAMCERLIADANHSIRRLAQAIVFLTGGGTSPLVVDVAT